MALINMRDFPDDLHRALKIKAAETGTTIKALMIRYCREGLKADKKGRKGKK
jgi:plasmid stability protein